MKKPVVFSLVHEQSLFMTIIMSLLTFLSVLALGVALSIGTGVARWNTQWKSFATVQVANPDAAKPVENILKQNAAKIESMNEVSKTTMSELMRPWMRGGGDTLEKYLPRMWEVKFKSDADMKSVGEQLAPHARFLTHATSLHASMSAGWKMIGIAGLVLILTLGAIGVCIAYIARNTAQLHKRELEILNQIGAHDSFVAHQMQIIVAKICTLAAAIGTVAALPMLLLILSAAHSARIGLMAMLGLSTYGWALLFMLPIFIIVFAIWTTKQTTLKILRNS